MRQVLVGVSAAVVLMSPLAAGAETVTVSGVPLQVTVKKTGPNQSEGTLDADADVAVEDQRLPLKAGKNVAWWVRSNTLASGTLREPVTVQIGGKAWNLAGDSRVSTTLMSERTTLHTVELAGNHTIAVEGLTFTAGPGTAQFGALDRLLNNFRVVAQEFTWGGVHVTLPEGAYVGLIDVYAGKEKKQALWNVQRSQAREPMVADLWGAALKVQHVGWDQQGKGQLASVTFASVEHPVAGQTVKLGKAKYDRDGVLEQLEVPKQTVTIDGTAQEVSGRIFVSPDLKHISKTKEGLAKLVASAPAAAPAPAAPAPPAAAAARVPPPPPPPPAPVPPGRPGVLKRPGLKR